MMRYSFEPALSCAYSKMKTIVLRKLGNVIDFLITLNLRHFIDSCFLKQGELVEQPCLLSAGKSVSSPGKEICNGESR